MDPPYLVTGMGLRNDFIVPFVCPFCSRDWFVPLDPLVVCVRSPVPLEVWFSSASSGVDVFCGISVTNSSSSGLSLGAKAPFRVNR